jgi:hypothetical protein
LVERFDRDLLAFVEEQQTKYRATVIDLAARDLLTSSEAEVVFPELELILEDRRGKEAVPIPHASNLPAHVEWSSAPF